MAISYGNGPYGPSANSLTINTAQVQAAQALSTANNAASAVTAETERAEAAEAEITQSIPSVPETLPYDLVFNIFDPISPSEVIGGTMISHAITIPANATTSRAACQFAPTTSTSQFNINVNGTQVGIITFAQNATTGSFTFTNPVTLNPGNIIEVVADADTFDTTISSVLITIVANYNLG
jgi:hypothetical protein